MLQAPENYVQDGTDGSWWYDPNGDVTKKLYWWKAPPIPDGLQSDEANNPGWWLRAGMDPNDPTAWYYELIWTPEEVAQAAGIPEEGWENVRANWPVLYQRMLAWECGDVMSCIGMIGTIAKESASTFAPVQEAYWLSDAAREAYYEEHHYNGYPGMGLIQTTGLPNYTRVRDETGYDVVSDPTLLLTIGPAAEAACVYWTTHGYGPPVELARAGNWEQVRESVLGGYDADGIARIQRAADYLLPIAQQRGAI